MGTAGSSTTPQGSRPAGHVATLVAVFVLSAGMLGLELTLTRVFALAQFYHFAFMVVSLALLGIGAAGSFLSVFPALRHHPSAWSIGFGLAAGASLLAVNTVPFDSYAIAWDRRQLIYLVLTLGVATAPFLCAGVVIGSRLATEPDRAHQLYGANMVGSALGSLLGHVLVGELGAGGAVAAEASLGLAAGALFGLAGSRAWSRRRAILALATAGLLAVPFVLAIGGARTDWLEVRLSPYKALAQALRAADARHTISRWSPATRIDVVETSSIHMMPGLSQNASIPHPPRQAGLTIDGDNMSALTALAPGDELAARLATHVPQAILTELRPGAERLILEPHGGWDVLTALASGSGSVRVVERRPEIVDVVARDYAALTHGIYADRRVEISVVEPRTYLQRRADRYPAIVVSLSDSHRPVTSGAYSLTEDYRYTEEAIARYLESLAPGGLLFVTRWLQTPPTEGLRLLATVHEALRKGGAHDPPEHVAVFRTLRTSVFLVAAAPLTASEIEAIRSFVRRQAYDLVWLPGMAEKEANRHNRLPEPTYYLAATELLADAERYIAEHEFDIRPATDDRPFFHHYFRWRQTPDVLSRLGRTWQPFGGSGYLVLVALLVLVSLLAALLVIGPLVLGRVPAGHPGSPRGLRTRALLYFSALGLAYLFVLIPLSQRLILFIGDAFTALAVTFFSVLLYSGLGSFTAPRWRLPAGLALLVVAVGGTPALLGYLEAIALGWPTEARLLATVLALAPVGLLMGVPFARGLDLMEVRAPGIIPWAWAVNGTASVLSGVLAVMIAISWGFSAVFWSGAICYGAALIAIWPVWSQDIEPPTVTPRASP